MLGKNKSRPREKKPFKAPNAYVIIFLFLVLAAVLTWIIPGGQYQLDESGNAIAGTYSQTESNPQGLWDIVMAVSYTHLVPLPAQFRHRFPRPHLRGGAPGGQGGLRRGGPSRPGGPL